MVDHLWCHSLAVRTRKASIRVMKELQDKGVIQCTTLRDKCGEEAVDEMTKTFFF